MTAHWQKGVRRFAENESGAALVEFALVMLLFFFVLFAIVDIGRLGSAHVLAEKAAQMAARAAIVRPAACPGVPESHVRPLSPGSNPPRFGTSCRVGSNVCKAEATVSCAGSSGNTTAAEIWATIQPLLPLDADISDLSFEYRFDQNLGFLGGPYTPMVTVSITPPDFQFISPLGAMAAAVGGSNTMAATAPYNGFSVSMPAEDLASGVDG